VTIGGVLYLIQHHADHVDYRTLSPAARHPHAFRHRALAAHFESLGLIQFGLLLLIATPSRASAWRRGLRSRARPLYTVVSLIVLLILIVQPDSRHLTHERPRKLDRFAIRFASAARESGSTPSRRSDSRCLVPRLGLGFQLAAHFGRGRASTR
jgi:hypothetical protein